MHGEEQHLCYKLVVMKNIISVKEILIIGMLSMLLLILFYSLTVSPAFAQHTQLVLSSSDDGITYDEEEFDMNEFMQNCSEGDMKAELTIINDTGRACMIYLRADSKVYSAGALRAIVSFDDSLIYDGDAFSIFIGNLLPGEKRRLEFKYELLEKEKENLVTDYFDDCSFQILDSDGKYDEIRASSYYDKKKVCMIVVVLLAALIIDVIRIIRQRR